MRIKCKQCGKTHAVVPLFVVPYSWVMLRQQIMIARGNGIVKTGDTTNTAKDIAGLGIAGTIIAGLGLKKKKDKDKK
jgi:hypothetical protein